MNPCTTCGKTFSRPDVLLRHVRVVHREGNDPGRDASDAGRDTSGVDRDLNVSSGPLEFKHPFSMVVSGPSGCGKTVWMRKLLLSRAIRPTPQRILWCYGQWQPLYDELRRELPEIEFINGIPADLGQPDFIDTSERNLIVFDDLMTDAKCDQRVADLFTKGRHHGNLSVAYLTQNLFPQGKACRDIALNTQYLALFNNPVDRQQVATLARRIYPTRSQWFMSRFERAVQRPYGYLVLDLKASTPESDRLHVDVFEGRGRSREVEEEEMESEGEQMDEMEAEEGVEEDPAGKDNDKFLRNLIASRVNASYESKIVAGSRPYLEQGDDTKAAQHAAIRDLLPDLRRTALVYIQEMLVTLYHVDKSPLYEELMCTMTQLAYSMSLEDAASETVRMYAPTLKRVLVPDNRN